jgi:hypothetical protein
MCLIGEERAKKAEPLLFGRSASQRSGVTSGSLRGKSAR